MPCLPGLLLVINSLPYIKSQHLSCLILDRFTLVTIEGVTDSKLNIPIVLKGFNEHLQFVFTFMYDFYYILCNFTAFNCRKAESRVEVVMKFLFKVRKWVTKHQRASPFTGEVRKTRIYEKVLPFNTSTTVSNKFILQEK